MDGDALLLSNAKIWTGSAFARSLTIQGGRVAALGPATGTGIRTIDLRGQLVVPGFIDNHLHFVLGGLHLDEVQLRDAESVEELARRVGERAARTAGGRWVTGGGWDEQRWSPVRLPSRAVLDPVARDVPVFVTRLDLHMGVANSVALQLAGITRETGDPPGGSIERDGRGEPTGVLKDAAMALVNRVIPPPSLQERTAAMRRALGEAARHGVTGFCDMGISAEAFDDFRCYERLDRDGELTARVWMYFPAGDWERLARAGLERGFGSSMLRIGGLKAFSDGSLGSSTAAFDDAYEGEPGNRGLLMRPVEDGSMARWIEAGDEAGLQLAIHAIGDRANRAVLDLLEPRPDSRTRRSRIEHAQHLDPTLVRRFAAGGVVAAAQPLHLAGDGRWAESKIGPARAAWAFPFRSLLDAGAVVTFGSDWPVVSIDPIAGIHAAVTRETLGANATAWIPEQRITVAEALRCYTASSAWAVFAERETGTIAPGMRADLAVLSDDLFSMEPGELRNAQVRMTVVGGRIVYEA